MSEILYIHETPLSSIKIQENGEKDAPKKTKYYFAYAREAECQTSWIQHPSDDFSNTIFRL